MLHAMLPLGSANATGSVEVADGLADDDAGVGAPADAPASSPAPPPPSPSFRNTSSSTTPSTTSTTSTMTKSLMLRAEVMPLRSPRGATGPPLPRGGLGDQDHTGRTGRANRPGQALRRTGRRSASASARRSRAPTS